MDQERARDLYFKYRAAVAYVAVRTPAGDNAIGTAFHVGDNVWITARHVVAGNAIEEIATVDESIDRYTERLDMDGGVRLSSECSPAGSYRVVGEPLLHPDETVDVAALQLTGPYSNAFDKPVLLGDRGRPTPVIALGGWLDDWLGDELTLEPALVLGYPPIPFGGAPQLVPSRAEVSVVLDKRSERHPYFVLSAMARGGFSGAPAITAFENALGVTTEALVMDGEPAQLGYFAVLSVEPIYDCLVHHGLLPNGQRIPGLGGDLGDGAVDPPR
jgi:trypsin-like peptidase